MAATPASEHTPYFDVPLVHFRTIPKTMEADSPAQLPLIEHCDCPVNEEKRGIKVAPGDDSIIETVLIEGAKDGDDPVLISSSLPMRSSSPPIDPLSRSMFTNVEGQRVNGSTFIGGAATTGPNATAEPNEQLHRRAVSAHAALTPKERSKIEKAEGTSYKFPDVVKLTRICS
jgi:hypothetical protein